MSHDLPDARKCTDEPSHPSCDTSNPCANGPTSECCLRKPTFQPCRDGGGEPKISPSIKPKAKRTRAGKAATFKVKVRNRGSSSLDGARICATVPRKKARNPKCQGGTIPAGRTLTRKFKVKLKRNAKGKVKVRFRLTTPGAAPRTAKAKIKVLPSR